MLTNPLTKDVRFAKVSDMPSGREQLAAWLRRTHHNQRQLARRISLTEAHLSQILSGVRRPGLPIAARIEDACGVPMRSWLTTRRGTVVRREKVLTRKDRLSKELSDHAAG